MSDETRVDDNSVEVKFNAEQAKEVLVHFTITLSENLIREQNGAVAVWIAQRKIGEKILEHAAKLSGVPNDTRATATVRALVENSRNFRKPAPPTIPPA
jgi:hypothetical protein